MTRPNLRLYNTLTRSKEDFVPIDASNVRMYVCGPTVYDYAHIGNARPVIVFDVLYRLLRRLYGESHVTYVRNITDVDDKINARAAERGISIRDLTEETNGIFQEDVAALGCLPPTVQPRATEHIAEMVAIVERLIASGHAYAADGHVLFSVPSMPAYGKLSRRSLDDMIAGARVDVAPYKKADTDFVLWKPSSGAEPGWDSPWGRGRPGWHLECSAMSWKHLGEVFDIHGGGVDLVFPHHENEIAQTCCAFGRDVMANVWMHNGFLQVEGEKMSKSLGNFVTIRDLLGRYDGCVIRYMMMKTHYRMPIDWRSIEVERSRFELRDFADIIVSHQVFDDFLHPRAELIDSELVDALSDDLNTPLAVSRLRELAAQSKLDRNAARRFAVSAAFMGLRNLHLPGAFNRGFAAYVSDEKSNMFSSALPILLQFKNYANNGLQVAASRDQSALRANFLIEAKIDQVGDLSVAFLDPSVQSLEERVEELLAARLEARKSKNWAESDRIRNELAAMGIALKDNKDGTTSWEVKR